MDLIKTRRLFHTFPELPFEEKRTTREIIKILQEFDCKIFYGRNIYKGKSFTDNRDILECDIESGLTGALAVVGEAPYIFIRADIDGLPVVESDDEVHAPSKNGFRAAKNMHACGHDGHITLGLALLEYFSEHNISAKILFQPAEEVVLGACNLDLDFILNDCTSALGFHIGLGQPSGTIGVGSTNFMAAQKTELTFTGRSAHACNSPQNGASAFNMAVAFYNLFSEITNDSRGRKVFNIGKIEGGEADNVVMKNCKLCIDMRSNETYLLDEMIKNLEDVAKGVATARGGSYKINFLGRAESYTENDLELVDEISKALENKNIKNTKLPNFGASEDVTTYINYVKENGGKGIHLLLGADLTAPHHSDIFDYDDAELEFYLEAIKIVADNLR